MEQMEVKAAACAESQAPLVAAASGAETVAPQHGNGAAGGSCPTCSSAGSAAAAPTFVYAIGRVQARFPRLSVEKEFAQATGREKTAGLTDPQTLHTMLSKRENRYLVRQMCWVMTVGGQETYIVVPRDPMDYELLVEAVRPQPSPTDLDVVVGIKGPNAPPDFCNGLVVPILGMDKSYSFKRDEVIKAIPRPEKVQAKEFGAAAEQVFDLIVNMTDNAGATNEHRALNYLAVRYPGIYAHAAEAFARNESLSAVDVRPSLLSGTRKIVEVIFSFTNRTSDVVTKQFVRVDVTEEFPFLTTKMGPYYDR